MNCEACRDCCVADGGLCNPMTAEERQAHPSEVAAGLEAQAEHDMAHAMWLEGAMWRCDRGHKVEAAPDEAMRAAGVEPML